VDLPVVRARNGIQLDEFDGHAGQRVHQRLCETFSLSCFLASGRWPDKTVFVLEERASATKGSINRGGHYQTDLAGLAASVKDEKRFPERWAYFSFAKEAQRPGPIRARPVSSATILTAPWITPSCSFAPPQTCGRS
jgi:hypothetical protein